MRSNLSKRYKKLLEASNENKPEIIDDVIKKVKRNCTAKFNESIDVSCLLNLKQKKEEISLRTLVNLPNGNGKKEKERKREMEQGSDNRLAVLHRQELRRAWYLDKL